MKAHNLFTLQSEGGELAWAKVLPCIQVSDKGPLKDGDAKCMPWSKPFSGLNVGMNL